MNDETHDEFAHDPHEDHGSDQHQEAEGEAWRGEPVDDFNDPAAATVSEEHEAPAEEFEAPKKRKTFLPVLIVVGGVIFLGIIAYVQFGGMLRGTAAPTLAPVADMAMPAPSEIPAKNPTSVAPKTAMASNVPMPPSMPSASPPTGQSGVAMPAVEPVPPAPPVTPSSAPAASDMAMMPPVPPDAPPSPVVPPAAPAVPSTVAPPAPPAPSYVPPVDTGATDARIATLTTRVDDLQKMLDQATHELSQINTKLISPPPAAGPSPMVDDRLNKIEQKLMQIEHAAPVVAENAPASPLASPTEAVMSGEAVDKTAAHKKSHHVTHHKKTHAHYHHVPVKTAAKTRWVLRAATPTGAWVAKDAVTTDLRPVHVGDTLAGVGRITAIHETAAGWVLEGTKGTVH